MEIEERIIKLIKSIDRIMDTWDNLTLRRAIVNIFSILVFIQIVIFTFILILGRDVPTNILGFMGLEFTAWGTILAYYFNARSKIDQQNNLNDIKIEEEERAYKRCDLCTGFRCGDRTGTQYHQEFRRVYCA